MIGGQGEVLRGVDEAVCYLDSKSWRGSGV